MGKESTGGVSASVGVDVATGKVSASAAASDRTLVQFGKAFKWMMPYRDAKVQITAALTARVVDKINRDSALTADEKQLVAMVFGRDARILANQQVTVERVQEVFPEVQKQLEHRPAIENGSTSQTFESRAESIAGETADANIRDRFARLIAGEMARPGSISLRTLELVRVLDTDVARSFDRLRGLAFNCDFVVWDNMWEHVMGGRKKFPMAYGELLDLRDAGLVSFGDISRTFQGTELFTFGEITVEVIAAHAVQLGIISLSRPGQELASVLPPVGDPDFLLMVGTQITRHPHISSVRWKIHADDWHPIEALAEAIERVNRPAPEGPHSPDTTA